MQAFQKLLMMIFILFSQIYVIAYSQYKIIAQRQMNWRNIHIQTPFVQSKSAVNGKVTQQFRHSRYTPLRSNSSQANQEGLQINKLKSLVGKTIQQHQTGQRSVLDTNSAFLQEIQNMANETKDGKMIKGLSKSKSKERKKSIFQVIAKRPNSKSRDRYQKNKSFVSLSINQDKDLKFTNVCLLPHKNTQLVRKKDRKYIVSQSWVIKMKSCLKQIIYCMKSMSNRVHRQISEMGLAMEQSVRKIKEQMQKQMRQIKGKMIQLDAQQMKLDDFQESILKQLLKPVALKKNQSFNNQCNQMDIDITSHNQEIEKQDPMSNKEEGSKISGQDKIKKQWRALEENINEDSQTGNLPINSNIKVDSRIEQSKMKAKAENSCSQKRCQNPQSPYKAWGRMVINRTGSPKNEVCEKERNKMDSNQIKMAIIEECKPSSKPEMQSTIQNMNQYIKNMRRMLEKLQ